MSSDALNRIPAERAATSRTLTRRRFVALLPVMAAGFERRAWAGVGAFPPGVPREFRGVWVATYANMDWPSQTGLSPEQQKAELTALFDRAAQLKLNAIIFQVRPACDALYSSRLEPWSEYLTGQMGQAPQPAYDPLAYAIQQAHDRGLELHAWFNPFRARLLSSKSGVASSHISRTRPKLVRKYGKYLWLDPGEQLVQQHSTAVILDVVKRYDLDGVHLDDYFYPYPEKDSAGRVIDFPDDVSWQRYRAGGGKLVRSDWRRKNIDDFVQSLYRRIKAEKSWVKFGISPFGIWRPGNPPSITGLDAYENLFADSRKWLMNGWADYFTPQLYWSIQQSGQSYPALLKWWVEQNAKGRHLWPGNNAANVGRAWRAEEIANQIQITRQQTGAGGNILWNVSSLTRNATGLGETLSRTYSEPALVPASSWLDSRPPGKPQLSVSRKSSGRTEILWASTGAEPVSLWVVQSRSNNSWSTKILPRRQASYIFNEGTSVPEIIAVTAVDRCGNVSPIALLETKPEAAKPR